MKIVDVTLKIFNYKSRIARDKAGHAHPGKEIDAQYGLLTITADNGSQGHCLYLPEVMRSYVVNRFFKTVLIGQDPFDRERIWQDLFIWQRGGGAQLTDRAMAVVDIALWDLAGRALGVPCYKLIGAYRDKVPAYASTMVGDDIKGGLSCPDDYARFAEKLVDEGYRAIKIHTWMPEVIGGYPDPKRDLQACAAVREAVGPDIVLMLDAYHWYTRSDALWLGKELGKLNYAWYEEPMEEASMSSYIWLTDNLEIPILGPEMAKGKYNIRAEWAKFGACDILRTGVYDVGGISPSMKVAHLAESFGMNCEVHGSGAANLTVVLAIKNGCYYERGLMHPMYNFETPPAYLKSLSDPVDAEGFVHANGRPGIGEEIDFEYIDDNLIS